MQLLFIRGMWGMELPTLEANLKKIKAGGFDGVEMGAPVDPALRNALRALLRDLDLKFIGQQWTEGASPEEHAHSFEAQCRRNAELAPLLINSHTGRDYYTTTENLAICKRAAELETELGFAVTHEIHRGRMTFSTSATTALLEVIPDLKFTADFSHWCCVHESYLHDQNAAVQRAIARTYHIHARVGHPESPQVTDPRAPEWQQAVEVHLSWWQQVVDHHKARGTEILTICPEFGPPDYMVTLPYTRQPIADLWEINCYMKDLLKDRLQL